jgi:cyclopropane fatty-acyl-phospholipid synthase-like methyltransferase
MSEWDEIWRDFKGLNILGRFFKRSQSKALRKILEKIDLKKNAKIIDIGCGAGHTLKYFRMLGYRNSVGVDISINSIKLCNKLFGFKLGKDVFRKDITKSRVDKYDLVFSDGMLEHFKDPSKLVKGICNSSRKWILLFQPNAKSLIGRLKNISEKLGKASWEEEHEYVLSDYMKMFEGSGFELYGYGTFHFGESLWILMKK